MFILKFCLLSRNVSALFLGRKLPKTRFLASLCVSRVYLVHLLAKLDSACVIAGRVFDRPEIL